MPGPIIALWIILGAAGSALLGPPKAWEPTDSKARPKYGKPVPVEYFTSTSSPRFDKPGICTFTMTAWVSRGELRRLRVNGTELLVDWSWTWDAEVPFGMRGEGMLVEFIHPVTRETATHELSAVCEWVPKRPGWGNAQTTEAQ